MHNCNLQLKASSNTLKDPSYRLRTNEKTITRSSLLRYTLCHRPTITDAVTEPQHLAVLRQRFSAAGLRPNSIMLSRSQTSFPTWLLTSSCGSATSLRLRPACDFFGVESRSQTGWSCSNLSATRSVTWIA